MAKAIHEKYRDNPDPSRHRDAWILCSGMATLTSFALLAASIIGAIANDPSPEWYKLGLPLMIISGLIFRHWYKKPKERGIW